MLVEEGNVSTSERNASTVPSKTEEAWPLLNAREHDVKV
jgi:hypothetical protein